MMTPERTGSIREGRIGFYQEVEGALKEGVEPASLDADAAKRQPILRLLRLENPIQSRREPYEKHAQP